MLNEVALAEEYLGELRPVPLEVDRSAAAIPVIARRFIIVPLIQQAICTPSNIRNNYEVVLKMGINLNF